jgi:hypothetical protein
MCFSESIFLIGDTVRTKKSPAHRSSRIAKPGRIQGDASAPEIQSQSIAVAAAVANQLRHESHWPPNDLNKIMGDDYHYDRNTMTNFLVAVRWHLAYGAPHFYFVFNDKFIVNALSLNTAQLTGRVDANTTAEAPAGWVAP